jgi:5-methylcytosine-specific restriction endonuclease McrA
MTAAALLHRPVFGGPFGRSGRYALATLPCVAMGLHAVRFLVIEPAAGTVVSIADTKLAALQAARDVLRASEQLARAEAMERSQAVDQLSLWPPEAFAQPVVRERARPVSKRRRDIFAKCGGACHYCTTPLRLEGPWHVEHMLPRSLGGLDEIGNLVAACVPCNLAKSDRTALEFVAAGGRGLLE